MRACEGTAVLAATQMVEQGRRRAGVFFLHCAARRFWQALQAGPSSLCAQLHGLQEGFKGCKDGTECTGGVSKHA